MIIHARIGPALGVALMAISASFSTVARRLPHRDLPRQRADRGVAARSPLTAATPGEAPARLDSLEASPVSEGSLLPLQPFAHLRPLCTTLHFLQLGATLSFRFDMCRGTLLYRFARSRSTHPFGARKLGRSLLSQRSTFSRRLLHLVSFRQFRTTSSSGCRVRSLRTLWQRPFVEQIAA